MLVPTVLAVCVPPSSVTMKSQRPSSSSHWPVSLTVMPCDWTCPGFTLIQSRSLYPRDWSMWGYLNPTRDSQDCSDVYFTVQKKWKAKGGGGLRVDECANPVRPQWCWKRSAHLAELKSPEHVGWMNFCIIYSSWALSLSKKIDQIPPCLSTDVWVAVRAAGSERGRRGKDQTGRTEAVKAGGRRRVRQLRVLHGANGAGLCRQKADPQWTTTGEFNSRWPTRSVSLQPFCVHSFFDTSSFKGGDKMADKSGRRAGSAKSFEDEI